METECLTFTNDKMPYQATGQGHFLSDPKIAEIRRLENIIAEERQILLNMAQQIQQIQEATMDINNPSIHFIAHIVYKKVCNEWRWFP